jgi:uncharacterized protein (TIGR01777 family)
MATVLITGGTGLIGRVLTAALLERKYRVIILSRGTQQKPTEKEGVSYAVWDIAAQTIDEKAVKESDYIIHLAGAGVADKRWTDKRKQEIVDSRVKSSELIVKALNTIPNRIKAVISASAIGVYGPDPVIPNPRPFTETDPPAEGFLGETCQRWEESITPVINAGKRLVILRTGIVMSEDGGALNEFKKPLRFGVAAVLGNGRQVISWIHIDDLARMYITAIENEQLQGIYNAVAPHPVSNKTLTTQLARKKGFFIPVHVPSFILKAVLGEMSIEVLKSATVSSRKIQQYGFSFTRPEINDALASIAGKKEKAQ